MPNSLDTNDITYDILASPSKWERWRKNENDSLLTPRESVAKILKASTSDIGYLRALQFIYYRDKPKEYTDIIRKCMLSNSVAVKSYALAITIDDERDERNYAHHSQFSLTDPATSLLENQLNDLKSCHDNSEFALEAQVYLMYSLAGLYTSRKDYIKSLECSSEAIYLSKSLNVVGLTNSIRMSYALCSMYCGNETIALDEYKSIYENSTNVRQRLFSFLNIINIHRRLGNYSKALQLSQEAVNQFPEREEAALTYQAARADIGFMPPDEPIHLPRFPVDEAILIAQRDLGNSVKTNRFQNIDRIIPIITRIQPKLQSDIETIAWIHAYVLLKLKKNYLAIQRLEGISPVSPIKSLLILCLKLEVYLSINSFDTASVEPICREIKAILESLPSSENRARASEVLAFWHPLAAAFVAMSPLSVIELADTAMAAVFKDGRPITVHGQQVQTHIPFLQVTLQYFGINNDIRRDQSAEFKRIQTALCTPWGEDTRLLPIVPPAILIYNYLLQSEKHGAIWKAAAIELAETNGVVPSTHGNSLRVERSFLAQSMEDLLASRIDISMFDKALEQFKRYPNSKN